MKLTFRTIARVAFLMILLLGSNIKNVFATHYAAADLYAEFIGRDSTDLRYRLTLTVYVACGGSPISAAEGVTIASGSPTYSRTKNMTGSATDTLDQLCKNFSLSNSCRTPGSIYPGFTRKIYVDTVVLPNARADWRFSWQGCNRNGSIENLGTATSAIATPDGSCIYIEAGLNNTGIYWGNSTPRYTIEPIPYLCVNQNNTFLNGPSDVDNDSMYTFNVNPRDGYNVNILYDPVYSLINPVASTTGYRVGPINGTSFFNPPNTGKFVLAFQTNAYDRYHPEVRTGYISRDVQVSVLPCNAPPPFIDTIPTNLQPSGAVIPGNIISICPNVTATFDVHASSLSNTNYVLLTSDNVVNALGSNFYVDTAGGVSTGHFTWTPTTADIGDHVINFTSTDTTCNPSQPILLKSYQVLTIRVLPGLDAGPDLKICPLGDNPVQLNVSGPPNRVYKWYSGSGGTPLYLSDRNIPNPIATPPVDYTYIVNSTDPIFACKRSDTVLVSVDRSNAVNVLQDPLVICRPSYNTIGADSVGPGPIKNLPCGAYNTISCPVPEVITVGNTGNTSNIPQNTPFYSNHRYHKYQFIIPKSELKNAGLYSGTLRSISFKSNNPNPLATMPFGVIKVGLACTERTSYPNVPLNESFETNTTVVATEPAYTITPNGWNSIQFTNPYNWDTTKNLIVDICMGPYTVVDTNGYDPVDMTPGQTIQRYSDVVDVCSGNAVFSDIVKYSQRPVVRFDYCSAPTLPYDFHWTPGTNLADSTIKYTTAYVPYSMNYAVYTTGKNGCLLRDSLHIVVPVYTLTVNPKDTAVCVNQPAPLHATGAQGYIWYENGFNTPTTLSCNDCADPIATPNTPGDIVYTVVYINPNNCFDTLQQRIHVYALPNVAIVNADTTIKYGKSLMLMVNGANQYTWTPVGSLNDPNTPNPVATPTQSTTYIVYGIDEHQCRAADSVRVNVDFRDNLLIPTGFTPNGDGRNDYFKVVNVTFQKLMEFRVFNRWGQEIFSTNDPMKGWDGKWKGIDQDLGTYKYIIRVAFPDGYVETYKGDVTLIR